MVDIVEERQQPRHLPAVGNDLNNAQQIDGQHNIVSAGESAAGEQDDFSATDEDLEDDEEGRAYYRWDQTTSNSNDSKRAGHQTPNNRYADLLYDENLDEEDEAYVYKHMRGGIREAVTINTASKKDPVSTAPWANTPGLADERETNNPLDEKRRACREQVVQMYKPRNSDAVLSCPCCFNIVCMDCQKHKRYANQYRAMFVMGVTVDWNHILVHDEVSRALVSKIATHNEVGEAVDEYNSSTYEKNPLLRAKDGEYYAIECATCGTQVAALDMRDEVYYFHGCLESSSAL
mmetsp:Transcript_9618/g.20840  ORF Transcript_9618/g.20840 Transcript_9618/m.20840 type:complete len:291 (+) Transcript_9618:85-957(+)